MHSLDSYEHSVINIVNGEHTGRKIGAPITDKALEMLSRLKDSGESSETYFSTNAKGEPLKVLLLQFVVKIIELLDYYV